MTQKQKIPEQAPLTPEQQVQMQQAQQAQMAGLEKFQGIIEQAEGSFHTQTNKGLQMATAPYKSMIANLIQQLNTLHIENQELKSQQTKGRPGNAKNTPTKTNPRGKKSIKSTTSVTAKA